MKIVSSKKEIDEVTQMLKFVIELENTQYTKYCVASFLGSVRKCDFLANLYEKDKFLYLETSTQEKFEKLCELLKNSIEKI